MDTIDEALIIAYFKGEDLTNQQKENVSLWLQEPENMAKAKESIQAWELSLLAQEVNEDIDAHWKEMSKKMDVPLTENKRLKTRWWWSAATLILTFGTAYLLYTMFSSKSTDISSLMAGNTEQEYTLPDKTKVILRSGAKLYYSDDDLNPDSPQRKLALEGDAYFDVESDGNTPFLVTTEDALIQVLGTKFYVWQNKASGTQVSVVEGVVKVRYLKSEKSFVINANESTNSNRGEITSLSMNQFFWHTKILNFKNEPLKNVFNGLGKSYGVNFQLQNTSIGRCLLTSEFENLVLDEVLEILSGIYQIKFDRSGGKIIVSGDGCD